MSYRSTPHNATSLSPLEILFNHKTKTRLRLVTPHINTIRGKEENILARILYPEDLVWVRNFNRRGING